MNSRIVGPLLIAFLALPVGPVLAAKAPGIRISDSNRTPECATPGRMMELLKARNGNLDSRFNTIATEYMRHGEDLGLRWDYAFYQMIVETGALSFKSGSRQGDVRAAQNNFAGLGATGGGATGESFKDVSSGVRAHLQHLLMYSGARVEDPVAERTRKVQEWGVLTNWHKKFKGPITYADMAQQWAPGSGGYVGMLDAIAEQFDSQFCKKADPSPDLVAAARSGKAEKATTVASARSDSADEDDRDQRGRKGKAERNRKKHKGERGRDGEENTARRDEDDTQETAATPVSGADLARKAVEDARAEGNTKLSALSAGSAPATSTLNIINGAKAEASAPMQTAAAAGAARQLPPPAASTGGKCKVWTASYGGQKSVIIKAASGEGVNYTVLDVNDGAEKREAEAYIAAYAKGGQLVGEFANQNQALDKAFELCPEG